MNSPLKRFVCFVLSVTTALLGFPALAWAQTPQLLREPEVLMSAADCAALLRHINYLSDPKTEQTLQKAYRSVQRLEDQAAGDVRARDEAFKKELWDQAKDELQDLAKKGYVAAIKSRAVELRQAAALHANSPSSLIWFRDTFVPAHEKLLNAVDDLEKRLKVVNALTGAYNDRRYAQGLKDAAQAARNAQQAQQELQEKMRAYEEAQRQQLDKAREDLLKAAGKKLASLGGPMGEVAFKIALLDISLALYLADTRDLSLAQVRESALTMRDQIQKLELNRNMAQHQYQRDCRPATRVVQQTPAPIVPAQTTQPPAQSTTSTSSGPGLGGVLLVGGLAAAAIAVGAAAAGSGGGSAKGCDTGFHQCTPPNANKCCPNGTTIYCTNNGSCTNLNSSTFGNLCGNQAAASNCGQ